MTTNALHWRDELALRILLWVASVLLTDANAEHRQELSRIRTTLIVGRYYGS